LYEHYAGDTYRKVNSEVYDGGVNLAFLRGSLAAKVDAYYGRKNVPVSGYATEFAGETDAALRESLFWDLPAFHAAADFDATVTHDWKRVAYASSVHDLHTVTVRGQCLVGADTYAPLQFRVGVDARAVTLDSTDMGSHDRVDGGVSLAADVAAGRDVLLVPAVRVVATTGGDRAPVAVPAFGVRWNAGEAGTVKGNAYRSFKQPDLEDLYWAGGGMTGNPELKSEDGWGADAGAAWAAGKTAAECVTFFQWVTDSIHWSAMSGEWHPENVGKATIFGVDLRVNTAVPLHAGPFTGLTLSADGQYRHSNLLSYGYGYGDEKRIPYTSAHAATLSAAVAWAARRGPGSVSLVARYEGVRYADTANLVALAPYALLTVNASQAVGAKVTAYAVVRNALNASYMTMADYPLPGTTVTVGVRF
jgi:vitamin B12 transporter